MSTKDGNKESTELDYDYDEDKDQLEEKQEEEPDLDKTKTINQVFWNLLVKVVEIAE